MFVLTGFEQALHAVGLRVTGPRLAVLEVLADQPHLAPDQVRSTLVRRGIRVSVQTVYDVLNALSGAGLVRRIESVGPVPRYELERHDNHHHLVCRTCRCLVDVRCAAGAPPCLHPVDPFGFTVEAAEVLYWGHCPRCRSTSTTRHEKGSRS